MGKNGERSRRGGEGVGGGGELTRILLGGQRKLRRSTNSETGVQQVVSQSPRLLSRLQLLLVVRV